MFRAAAAAMNSTGILTITYDDRLVALSVVLAVFASYAALDLAGRVTASQGKARAYWLTAGGAALGVGIWSMHCVGMLALNMPTAVYYHVPTVMASLLAAIAASIVMLNVAGRTQLSSRDKVAGSMVMGGGIATMHYIGMTAMRSGANAVYDLRKVALSIVLAVGMSLLALILAFRMREEQRLSRRKMTSALVMGGAISLIHYTGMWSASFRESASAVSLENSVSVSGIGAVAISACGFVVLGAAIASSLLDRRLSLHRANLNLSRERELYFQTMAEAVPEIIWTATPDGQDDYFNQRCFDYTGMTSQQLKGSAWTEIVHPEDVEQCLVKWQNALRSGAAYDVEYRLRGSDKGYRWFLGRARPIRNFEGAIVKWFGICTDIETQKQSQEILQGQVQERTEQLAEAKNRLQRELYFQMMAEGSPDIIWTADRDGAIDFTNRKWLEYSGLSMEQSQGRGWVLAIHADDSPICIATWESALSRGEPYETEYRLRAKDGTFRWFLVRANPVMDEAGNIVKWFGSCTDIENQKQSQQVLEEQILERTAQLADLNTRLQEEMLEKDYARNELDQQNERMMAQLRERTQRATMLAKMGELLQSCMNRDEVFAAALGYAPKIFPILRGSIALLDASRSVAEIIGSWNECNIPVAVFEPASCWALRTGHPHLVLEGDSTAPCAHAKGVKNTYLCVPILAQGETLGVMNLQATADVPLLESSDLSIKTTFAGQVGLSIANIRLREALRIQSVRDALTGLYNRRYLEEVLEREVRRAARAAQSLGILMIDLDHFKNFNDTYGHDAGDAVLRETGQFLVKGIRAEDFVCRFGGEEFVVILPTADMEASRGRAERLCQKMRELTVMHQGKSLGMVTISIGVAAFPLHGMSPKELMAAADAALYEAKRSGRNQVVVASPTQEKEVAPGKEVEVPDIGQSAAGWS